MFCEWDISYISLAIDRIIRSCWNSLCTSARPIAFTICSSNLIHLYPIARIDLCSWYLINVRLLHCTLGYIHVLVPDGLSLPLELSRVHIFGALGAIYALFRLEHYCVSAIFRIVSIPGLMCEIQQMPYYLGRHSAKKRPAQEKPREYFHLFNNFFWEFSNKAGIYYTMEEFYFAAQYNFRWYLLCETPRAECSVLLFIVLMGCIFMCFSNSIIKAGDLIKCKYTFIASEIYFNVHWKLFVKPYENKNSREQYGTNVRPVGPQLSITVLTSKMYAIMIRPSHRLLRLLCNYDHFLWQNDIVPCVAIMMITYDGQRPVHITYGICVPHRWVVHAPDTMSFTSSQFIGTLLILPSVLCVCVCSVSPKWAPFLSCENLCQMEYFGWRTRRRCSRNGYFRALFGQYFMIGREIWPRIEYTQMTFSRKMDKKRQGKYSTLYSSYWLCVLVYLTNEST